MNRTYCSIFSYFNEFGPNRRELVVRFFFHELDNRKEYRLDSRFLQF